MTKEDVEKLIIDNENIAYKLSWKYYPKVKDYIELEDMFTIGKIGLVKAANSFDNSKGFKFSTYAYKVITNEILMELRKLFTSQKLNSFSLDIIVQDDMPISEVIASDIDYVNDITLEETMSELYAYIYELPDELKKIILLHLDGLTQIEIGKVLKLSQAQVSRLLSKAINILRKKFNVEGGE